MSSLVSRTLSPLGVRVSLLIDRSGLTVVELAPWVVQSLVGFGSPSPGGIASNGSTPAGTELPVHAVLVTVPLISAFETMVSLGSSLSALSPPPARCSQTITGAPLASQLQPEPEKLTKDSPDRTSITRSGPVAVRGPLFVTVMIDVTFEP